MSPRRKLANISVFLAAGLSTVGLMGRGLDSRYVHTSTFAAYQQSQAQLHETDSLTYGYALMDLRRMVAGLDSSDRCRRLQKQFCR